MQPTTATELGDGPPAAPPVSAINGDLRLAPVIQRFVEAAPGLDALRKHRLHLAAARLWESRGRELPADLLSDTRTAAVHAMLALVILKKVRAAYDGPLMLMKGPEVAAHYPVSSDRPFRDLDLLAEDPEAAQGALVAAGFVEEGDRAAYSGIQHLPPLIWPDAPLVVEVHRRPSRPFWLAPVSAERVFGTAVPSATGVSGIVAPEPAAHAVLVVAHAWNHDPLGSIGHLLDAAALLASADHQRARMYARAWGWEKMWTTTLAVMDALLGDKRPSPAMTLWARHLIDVRERVVLEDHLSRLAAPASSLPARQVPRAVACALRYTATPEPDENWNTQLRRSRLAIAHAFSPGSEHDQSLAWIGPRTTPPRQSSVSIRRQRVRRAIEGIASRGDRP